METKELSAEKRRIVNIAFRNNYNESNKIFEYMAIGSAILCQILGAFYGEKSLSFVFSVLMLLVFYSIRTFIESLPLKSILSAFVTTFWPGVFIIISHGLTETHYLYFVFIFLVVIYQNYYLLSVTFFWAVVIEALFYIILVKKLPYHDIVEEYLFNVEAFGFEQFFWTLFSTVSTFVLAFLLVKFMRQRTIKQVLLLSEQQQQLNEYNKYIQFAKNIAEGKLTKGSEISSSDYLGQYLLNMRSGIAQIQKKLENEKKINDYINVGIMEIDNILRNHYQSIESLSEAIISSIVNYLNADIGALFITRTNEDNKQFLETVACHSYGDKRYYKKRIEIGEGLVGVAFLEQEPIYMTEIPDDYIKITTGLGGSLPAALLIVPLKAEGKIIGVLELASLKVLEQHHLKLIYSVSEHIASTIISTLSKQETASLLDETKRITKQLQQKEKELNLSIRKMTNVNKMYEDKLNKLRLELKSKGIELSEKEQMIELLHQKGHFKEMDNLLTEN